MPPGIDLTAILALPPAERIALAEALWESVGAADIPVPPEMLAEIRRRLDRHAADPTNVIPWDEIDVDAAETVP